jgi:predicted glycogen debranching enzyme
MKLPRITLNEETLLHFEAAIQKEWLVTNGLAGYASSTALGVNTRKYHGLLVAALNPPLDRRVYLVKLDEDITVGGDVYRLGTNEFQNGFFPQGYTYLKEFSISPFPKYVYEVQGIRVEKTLFMPSRKNAVIVIYKILNANSSEAKVQVYPIISGRRFHSVIDRTKVSMEFTQKQHDRRVEMSSFPQPVLMMAATSGHYIADGKWIEGMYLREEAKRGESFLDDCYQPGDFEMTVGAGKNQDFAITAVADGSDEEARKILSQLPSTATDTEVLHEREMNRREESLTRFYDSRRTLPTSDWLSWVVLATEAFIVGDRIGEHESVIAGYHWFEAWGRDTFVSMPGLTLVTGRFEDARALLLNFQKYCEKGLLPNFLSEQDGKPVYNTVDTTLWYVNAVLQYVKYTNDFRFVQERLWDTLKEIVENHVKGTSLNIRVDADGLLAHGPQCTWMDANIDGKPVTPRAGKAVEVQALWFNTLKTVELLAKRFGENKESEVYSKMCEKTRKSFAGKFWNAERDCLFDVLGENQPDGSIRPNQIFAVSLDFTMFDNSKNEKVVRAVQDELLTPYGLRTLERKDSRYVGVYSGARESRDRAYHNGTVWPWLLGPFTTAFLKINGYSSSAREHAWNSLLAQLLERKIYEMGLGTLSEIFDGDPPSASKGCVSQAWSVAEPLRAYVEDVRQLRPKYEREVLHA